jgi:hypothetical protein
MTPTVSSHQRSEALREAIGLSGALERIDFAGWDPYDALSAPPIRRVARTALGRQAAIQLFKRSPVNLRPLLGMQPQRHTKALALCVSAYSSLARLPDGDRYRSLALTLADDLAGRVVLAPAGSGWAYDFDVQTRWGFYPAGKPNAVVTAFAIQALLDASVLPDANPGLRQSAESAAQAVPETFFVPATGGGFGFFGYYRGAQAPIHNANALLASAVAGCAWTEAGVYRAAADAIAFTVELQRPDGSWPYGERRGLDWVDGYHTAYILIALGAWLSVVPDPDAEAALERGLRFYVERLFEPSGAPRATVDRLYPIDIHGASSAIWTLSTLRVRLDAALPLADRVLDWTRSHMRRRDGRYAFQLHKRYRNSVSYIRWSDAHMLLALAARASAGSDDAR